MPSSRNRALALLLLSIGAVGCSGKLGGSSDGDGSTSNDDGSTSNSDGSTSNSDGSTVNPDGPVISFDAGDAPYCEPRSGTNLKLTSVATGLAMPVAVTAPNGDPRLFIVQKRGLIKVVSGSSTSVYLNLSNKVSQSGDERGLLGLAFHPGFASNGRFFVFYTSTAGNVTVSEFGADPTSNTANTTERVILTQTHSARDNHNGGTVAFGPDGMLYISLGDGGGANNELGSGQSRTTKLAKILRINVDDTGAAAYTIPAGNPWASSSTDTKEMWAWGLRNPYRFTIDPATGDMYIGDVGQGTYEEINYVRAGESGLNFGWSIREGSPCFGGGSSCSSAGLTAPLVSINRTQGVFSEWGAIIAGPVYRGSCMTDWGGTFFYGDFKRGAFRTLRVVNGVATADTDRTSDLDPSGSFSYDSLSSFGVDGYGEIYAIKHGPENGTTGAVYRVEVE